MFLSPKRWVRKVSLMLTQGALRQRRRRALESAEERRERLARDAERKRIKRMSESAEEAAWRRTVDAMRKKEKRMKERETKAIMAQYSAMPAECIKADCVNSDNEVMMKVVRPFPRKRRARPGVGDYFLSFPEALADVTEFGSGPTTPNLCDLVTGIPGTSRVSNSTGARCSPHHDDTIHCFSTGDGAGVGVVGSSNFRSVVPSRGGASSCGRALLPAGSAPSKRHHHHQPRRVGLHASHQHHNRTPIATTHPAPPAGCWCPGPVSPVMVGGECDVVVATAAAAGGDKAMRGDASLMGSKEDFLDSSPDESLSALSPEVIISEVKPEPLEDEEEQLSDERIRQAALSLLSPEVIIREVKMVLPPSGSCVGTNSHRRPPGMDECTGQQLRGHWFASPSLSVNAMPAEGGRQDATSTSLYNGRPRGDYILSV